MSLSSPSPRRISLGPSTPPSLNASRHSPRPSAASHRPTSAEVHASGSPSARRSKSASAGSRSSREVRLAFSRNAFFSFASLSSASLTRLGGNKTSTRLDPNATASAKMTTGATALSAAIAAPPVAKTANDADGITNPKSITAPNRSIAGTPTVAKNARGRTIESTENASCIASAEATAPAVHDVAAAKPRDASGFSPTHRTTRRREGRSTRVSSRRQNARQRPRGDSESPSSENANAVVWVRRATARRGDGVERITGWSCRS
mmetsp:Transcript_15160/g.64005  ORF Transcript_15160/g.64005 Transcript_15160/m.64005 type:complete len:263 (+) Transcript_15160:250-1038(+)